MTDSAASQHMTIDEEHRGTAVVLVVRGELDLLTAPVFGERMRKQLERTGPLVVDLEGVTYLSTAAVAELATASQDADKVGVTFRLVCTTRAVLRPLEETGLANSLDIRKTREAALSGA